jgi:hypothetical protein
MIRRVETVLLIIANDGEALTLAKAVCLVLPSIFLSPDVTRSELIDMAANLLLALMRHPRAYQFAVVALNDATDVQNVSVVRVFYDQRFFDCYFALCGDESASVRSNMLSVFNHFTQLGLSDIERFLLPALQSLDLTHGEFEDCEIEKILEIGYRLIVRGPELAAAVFAAPAFGVFGANASQLAWHAKVLWCVCCGAGWRVMVPEVCGPLFECAAEFLSKACEVFESADYLCQKVILEGMVALKMFVQAAPVGTFEDLFAASVEFVEFKAVLHEKLDSEDDDCFHALSVQLFPPSTD